MKERLTGAIILVALIVLLVPELLTGPVASGSSQTAATSTEEPPLRSYTINLSDDARARTAASSGDAAAPELSGAAQPAPAGPSAITEGPAGAANAPAGSATGAAVGGGASAPTEAISGAAVPRLSGAPNVPVAPQGTEGAARPERPAAPERPVTAGDGRGWMVQLGVFASRSNADRLAQELKQKGFRISVSETPGTGRKLFRVRAGPVSDRGAAADLAERLRAAGAPGSVVPRT